MSGFGDFLIGCGPALTEVIFVLAAILAFTSALRLLAWARRCRRARLDGQARRERDLPQLARAIGNVERRTRAMNLGGHACPPHDDHISDRTPTEQWRAAFGEMTDALTPRMVAPTRADLIASCGFCHDIAVMGSADDCRCKKPCGVKWCTALRRQVPRG